MNRYQGFILILALFLVPVLAQYMFSFSIGSENVISRFSPWVQRIGSNHQEQSVLNVTREYANRTHPLPLTGSASKGTQPYLGENEGLGRHLKYILSLTFDEKTGVPKVDRAKKRKSMKDTKLGAVTSNASSHTAEFWQTLASRQVPGVDCGGIIKGDTSAASQGIKTYAKKNLQLKGSDFLQLAQNCSDFRLRRGYIMEATEEERDFPIAFSLLTYKDLQQTERLLRAVYRPHNLYCIHLERTSPESMYRALSAISSCLPNVVLLPKQFHVARYLMSVIQPELECMRHLWNYKLWKYFINLTGQEFPIATNLEMVHMLKTMGDRNVIYGYEMKKSKWEWRIEHKYNGFKKTPALKKGPPHNITVYKGPVHIAATRAFVDAILHNQDVDDFLGWLLDTRTPDESFFTTLNYNAHLGIQGAYHNLAEAKETESRMSPLRFKQFFNEKWCPKNRITHDICIIGTRLLPDVVQSGAMFANKFHTEYESVAYACLEQWHYNKILKEQLSDTIDKLID